MKFAKIKTTEGMLSTYIDGDNEQYFCTTMNRENAKSIIH